MYACRPLEAGALAAAGERGLRVDRPAAESFVRVSPTGP